MPRKAILSDIPAISRCHAAAFPHSLSTRLGHKFLRKMYSWYFEADNRFLFLDENELGECRGILGGMIRRSPSELGSTSGMIQASKCAAFYAILIRPWLWGSGDVRRMIPIVFKNIVSSSKKTHAHAQVSVHDTSIEHETKPRMGIVVIGVDPQFRKQGVGTSLLNTFENHAHEKGIANLALSVNRENTGAIAFYEKSGWSIHHEVGDGFHMIKLLA